MTADNAQGDPDDAPIDEGDSGPDAGDGFPDADSADDNSSGAVRGRGRLVLVATPIGNLGDLSPRAVRAMEIADVLACEDTRRTGKLLTHAGIRAKRMMVLNDHTEDSRSAELVGRILSGEVVALVSDAGTPGISDPGERLVAAVVAAGGIVEAVPGPAAVIAALVSSGFSTSRFVMEGFLPRKGRPRSQRLTELSAEQRTIVVYEAPHRLVATLGALAESFGGDRRVAVARELTKMHEEIWRGTLGEAAAEWAARTHVGEVVLVLEGAPPAAEATDDLLAEFVRAELAQGASVRDAAAAVAAAHGVAKRRVYALAIAASNESSAQD